MLTIDIDNNITMTRGDTAKFNIGVFSLDNNSPYVITANDVVMFTLRKEPKKSADDVDFLIQKEAPLGLLTLDPADTEDLAYITYYYDIQITLENLEVYTIIGWRKFTLEKEST